MTTASSTAAPYGRPNVFRRAENWLDDHGKGAWIAAMVLGFIFFWPVGLALLAYMIWGKKMFRGSCGEGRHHHFGRFGRHGHGAYRASGNTAFDNYKTEMLRRLEDEQRAFESFLQRLREAKDKSEFDAFMDDRAKAAAAGAADDVPPAPPVQEGRAGAY